MKWFVGLCKQTKPEFILWIDPQITKLIASRQLPWENMEDVVTFSISTRFYQVA